MTGSWYPVQQRLSGHVFPHAGAGGVEVGLGASEALASVGVAVTHAAQIQVVLG